jgi:hypothetical protein
MNPLYKDEYVQLLNGVIKKHQKTIKLYTEKVLNVYNLLKHEDFALSYCLEASCSAALFNGMYCCCF